MVLKKVFFSEPKICFFYVIRKMIEWRESLKKSRGFLGDFDKDFCKILAKI